MSILWVILLFFSTYSYALFEYDRAVASVQRAQFPQAITLFNNLIAQEPNKADLVYDAGVAAFKNGDYAQAKAYFQEASENNAASKQLKAQAYFNKGNTHVALNELKEALLSYEQMLLLFPDDGRAQHNYDVIKKMLEQQEQQNEDQNKQQDKQDQKNNDQSKQEQDQQNNSDNDESHDQQSSQNKDPSKDTTDNQQKKDRDQREREQEGFDQDSDEKNDQQDRTEQQQNQSQDKEDGQEGGESQQRSEQEKKEEQQNRQHESPLPDEPQQQDMKDAQKEQENMDAQDDIDEQVVDQISLDPKLQQVLQKRADRDAALNKQMVKALVSQEMKGQHGQNCW